MVLLVLPVWASVYDPPEPYAMVFLPKHKASVETDFMRGTYKIFNGVNYSTSEKNVRFQAKYSNGNGWVNDVVRYIEPNQTFGDTETNRRNTGIWKLTLSTYWYNQGGEARGNMWYYQ